MATQSLDLPLLDLSSSQKLILNAHIADSMMATLEIRFSTGKELEGMLASAFEQGKITAYKQLITYDNDQLAARQEQIHTQGEQ